MSIKLKKVLFWVLAVVISIGTMIYQRKTGPSYPKKYEITVEGESHTFTLPRSNQGRQSDYPVELELPESFSGKLIWRREEVPGPPIPK